jgi:hypothetical protein
MLTFKRYFSILMPRFIVFLFQFIKEDMTLKEKGFWLGVLEIESDHSFVAEEE